MLPGRTRDHFYPYVVDNLACPEQAQVRIIPGTQLLDMIARTEPRVTYWPPFASRTTTRRNDG
jgi:hypothetical protein